jgi:hypothetical protein
MVEYFGEFAKIQFSREVADRRNSGKMERDYLNGSAAGTTHWEEFRDCR